MDRAEAQAVFSQHFGSAAGYAAASGAVDGRLALVRPCAWPHPPRLASVLEDSAAAAVALELSVLEACAAELAARQALQAAEGAEPGVFVLACLASNVRCGKLSTSHAWHPFYAGAAAAMSSTVPAALLPVQLLHHRLMGGLAHASHTAVAASTAAPSRDMLLRLLWAAAQCLTERCPRDNITTAVALLKSLGNRLKVAPPAFGLAAVPGEALQQVVDVLLALGSHPAVQSLAGATAQLQRLLALEPSAAALLPMDPTRADGIMPALAAAGALTAVPAMPGSDGSAAAAAPALLSHFAIQGARLVAARDAQAAAAQMSGTLSAAESAVAAGTASLLQQSYWRHTQPKVRVSIVLSTLQMDILHTSSYHFMP